MFSTRLKEYQDHINKALDEAILQNDCIYGEIFEAMRYSLNAGGKRIRPVLVLEFAWVFGVAEELAMPFAVALEMIHTYSLIHDDLPCMDDDDLRRGRPTNHKMFGEATAVLAGDALLNRAFEHVLKNSRMPADVTLKALSYLATSSGADGMIGGQIIDMAGETRALSLEEIHTLQSMKTGALIRAGAVLGCILGKASDEDILAASEYAENLGLAFQIKDDILNVEGDSAVLGKDVGNDERSGKSTFVKLIGLLECKAKVVELTKNATEIIKKFSGSEFLIWLSEYLITREN